VYSERKVCDVCNRKTSRQISEKQNIVTIELYSKIRAKWAAAHFDLGLT